MMHRTVILTVVPLIACLLFGSLLASAKPPQQTPTPASQPDLQPFTHPPEFFPILPWDVLHGWAEPDRELKHGLESIAACNFTMAGFVKPEALPLCEKLGLAAIMAPAQGNEAWSGDWQKLSDEQIDQQVKRMVEKAGSNKAVMGYFLMDEPGSPAFAALGKAVAALKKYAPGKLAYINLFPSYATTGAPGASQLGTASYTEYLERFVNEVKPQFISYDNYMVQYSGDMQAEAQAASYYGDLLEVRRVAQKYHLPFWNIVAGNQLAAHATIPSPANLAFQAFTTLAAGGRGVSWFTYFDDGFAYSPIDKAGNQTESWLYLQMVNRQVRTLGPIMSRLQSTGVYFTSPPPVKALPLLPGRIVKQVQSKAPHGGANASLPVMVGEFTDESGADYVMIVNLSLEKSANIKIETAKAYPTKQVFSAMDGRLVTLDEQNGHWLVAGQGVLITLR
jgi:hypothetical protein